MIEVQACALPILRKSSLHLTVILRRAWALTQRLPRKKFPAELRPRALRRPSQIWKDVSIKKPSKQEPNHECKPGYESAILPRCRCAGSEVPSGCVAPDVRTLR